MKRNATLDYPINLGKNETKKKRVKQTALQPPALVN